MATIRSLTMAMRLDTSDVDRGTTATISRLNEFEATTKDINRRMATAWNRFEKPQSAQSLEQSELAVTQLIAEKRSAMDMQGLKERLSKEEEAAAAEWRLRQSEATAQMALQAELRRSADSGRSADIHAQQSAIMADAQRQEQTLQRRMSWAGRNAEAAREASRMQIASDMSVYQQRVALEDRHYELTHSSRAVELRRLQNHYAQLRAQHANNAAMLLQIDRTYAAEQAAVMMGADGKGLLATKGGKAAGRMLIGNMLSEISPEIGSATNYAVMASMAGASIAASAAVGGIALVGVAAGEMFKAAEQHSKSIADWMQVTLDRSQAIRDNLRFSLPTTHAGEMYGQTASAALAWRQQIGAQRQRTSRSSQSIMENWISSGDWHDWQAAYAAQAGAADNIAANMRDQKSRQQEIAQGARLAAAQAATQSAMIATMVDGPQRKAVELAHRHAQEIRLAATEQAQIVAALQASRIGTHGEERLAITRDIAKAKADYEQLTAEMDRRHGVEAWDTQPWVARSNARAAEWKASFDQSEKTASQLLSDLTARIWVAQGWGSTLDAQLARLSNRGVSSFMIDLIKANAQHLADLEKQAKIREELAQFAEREKEAAQTPAEKFGLYAGRLADAAAGGMMSDALAAQRIRDQMQSLASRTPDFGQVSVVDTLRMDLRAMGDMGAREQQLDILKKQLDEAAKTNINLEALMNRGGLR